MGMIKIITAGSLLGEHGDCVEKYLVVLAGR